MMLEKQAKKEIEKNLKNDVKTIREIKALEEIIGGWWYRKQLTNRQLEKIKKNEIDLKQAKKLMIANAEKNRNKELKKALTEIEKIKNAEKFSWGRIDIAWNRNSTWGWCPSADYRNGHVFEHYNSVTGCGYDKLSTLTAKILNHDVKLMKIFCEYCEKNHVNKENIQKKVCYGVRMFHGMPYFEGAVGIECHIKALKKIGFDVVYYSLKNAELLEIKRNK